MSDVCTVPYRAPNRRIYEVDVALEWRVLDRLNALPGLSVYSVCAGHRKSEPGHNTPQRALVILMALRAPHEHGLLALAPYLERLSSTEYAAVVEKYRGNGGPGRWRLLVERSEYGPAPKAWWRQLVNVLEDNPDCSQWLPT